MPEDELWILGDFSNKINQDEIKELRRQIKCKHVHLIYGKHDKRMEGMGIFQSAQDYKILKTEYGLFVFFHYPILDWYARHCGAVHLHGLIHSTGEYNDYNLKKRYGGGFLPGHTAKIRLLDIGFMMLALMQMVFALFLYGFLQIVFHWKK